MNFSCDMLLPGLKPRNAAHSSKNANQTAFCARFGQPGLIPHDQLRSPSCCKSCLSYGSYGSYGNALQDRKVRHLENMRKTSPRSHPGNTFSNHWSVPFLGVFLLFHSQFPENSSHAKSFHHRSLNRRRPWVVLPPNPLPRLRGHLHPARDRIGRWGCRENPVAASLSGRSVSASPGSYRTLKINKCLDHRNISKQVKTLFASIIIYLSHIFEALPTPHLPSSTQAKDR